MKTQTVEVSEIEAGRDLDALVAERVMGRRLVCLPTVGNLFDWLQETTGPGNVESVPFYSIDIAAAWRMVEQFDSYHLDWNELDKIHECKLLDYRRGTVGTAEAETPALAICRAALIAVGVNDG